MKTAPKYLQNHQMFTAQDFNYLAAKGYTNQEIKALWDRDLAEGKEPVTHSPANNRVAGRYDTIATIQSVINA